MSPQPLAGPPGHVCHLLTPWLAFLGNGLERPSATCVPQVSASVTASLLIPGEMASPTPVSETWTGHPTACSAHGSQRARPRLPRALLLRGGSQCPRGDRLLFLQPHGTRGTCTVSDKASSSATLSPAPALSHSCPPSLSHHRHRGHRAGKGKTDALLAGRAEHKRVPSSPTDRRGRSSFPPDDQPDPALTAALGGPPTPPSSKAGSWGGAGGGGPNS